MEKLSKFLARLSGVKDVIFVVGNNDLDSWLTFLIYVIYYDYNPELTRRSNFQKVIQKTLN